MCLFYLSWLLRTPERLEFKRRCESLMSRFIPLMRLKDSRRFPMQRASGKVLAENGLGAFWPWNMACDFDSSWFWRTEKRNCHMVQTCKHTSPIICNQRHLCFLMPTVYCIMNIPKLNRDLIECNTLRGDTILYLQYRLKMLHTYSVNK